MGHKAQTGSHGPTTGPLKSRNAHLREILIPTGAMYATDPWDTVTWVSSDASWCARPASPTCRTGTRTVRQDTTQGSCL